ncbi:hypothetical protein FLGE108171_14580 [Flavobacterium gelidilacus]|uniref:hypothetical protein n=1 Tax=Flavobacterium gelidilacus TaxID=206041 RepID=UPI00040BBDB6|nr:hypothetical protein [Flavobacterium gelidilacus]
MEKLYSIVILITFTVIIVKVYNLFFKNDKEKQKATKGEKAATENSKSDQNPIPTNKNKWLYPSDNFGNLEKGTVYNSITFNKESEDKNTSQKKMKILTNEKGNENI